MATFRGQDGAVFIAKGDNSQTAPFGDSVVPDPAAGGTGDVHAIGEVMSWSLTFPREKLDISVMGDASKRYRLGMKDWSGTIGCRLDGGDMYQKQLIDQALANNPDIFTFVFYVNRTGAGTTASTNPPESTKYFRGNGYVELSNVGAELSSIDDVEFNIIPAGDLSIEWA